MYLLTMLKVVVIAWDTQNSGCCRGRVASVGSGWISQPIPLLSTTDRLLLWSLSQSPKLLLTFEPWRWTMVLLLHLRYALGTPPHLGNEKSYRRIAGVKKTPYTNRKGAKDEVKQAQRAQSRLKGPPPRPRLLVHNKTSLSKICVNKRWFFQFSH